MIKNRPIVADHGFTPADGVVFEGKVLDLASQQPVAGTIQLQRIKPLPKGGYDYSVTSGTVAAGC